MKCDSVTTCTFSGASFYASTIDKSLLEKFQIMSQNDVGDTGVLGRYKGKKIPYGSITLAPINKNLLFDDLLFEFLSNITIICDKIKYTELDVSLTIGYENQFNFELQPRHIEVLYNLNIGINISALKADNND